MKETKVAMIWLLACVAVLAVLGLATWLVLTQPMRARSVAVAGVAKVEPSWLEERVRALVAIASRSYDYPENLDRAAAYVHGELALAGG